MDMLVQFGGGFLIGLCAAIVPGPDTLLVVRSVAVGGARGGFRAALGIGVGLGLHALATLLLLFFLRDLGGLGFLSLVQILGGLYLAYLGVESLKSAMKGTEHPTDTATCARDDFLTQGLVTNLTNPKAIIFFTAVVSQFLANGDMAGGTAALSGIALAAPAWFVCLSLFTAGLFGPSITGRRQVIDWIAGCLFLGLAGYALASVIAER